MILQMQSISGLHLGLGCCRFGLVHLLGHVGALLESFCDATPNSVGQENGTKSALSNLYYRINFTTPMGY